jgi:dolichol-phosphate mannosyltransferase
VQAFNGLQEEYELIFVNDGSRDKTKEILKELCAQDSKVKAVHFSRNFGQQAAILCGLEKASGEAVIVMDADLQDPPSVAIEMIEKWKQGYQIVHGKRRSRKQDKPFKRWTAKLFYKKAQSITGLQIPQNVGDFKLYDRKVVDAILSMPEHDRLLRAQTAWLGFKQTFVEFDRPERVAGETHYTLKKMVRLANAGIFPNTQFHTTFPLIFGIILGILSLACFITFIVLGCADIYYGGMIAWLFPTIACALAISLVCQGLSNIHLNMIYKEVQNRPKYVVAEKINL